MNLLNQCTSNATGDKGKDNRMFMIGTDVQKVIPCGPLNSQGRGERELIVHR